MNKLLIEQMKNMKRVWTTVSVDGIIWKKFLSKAIEKYGSDVAKAKKSALDEAMKMWIEKNKG